MNRSRSVCGHAASLPAEIPGLADTQGRFPNNPFSAGLNTIDLRQFTYRRRDPLRPRLICTRNFEPLYNVSCVLRAFARIQARHPEATLMLVGGGSQEDALRAQITELRLKHVTLAGRVAPSEIQRYYADADIYLQASSIDNMPLSLLEAFASGLPVVSTGVGGIPSILRDGLDGLLAPDNDDTALATHVLKLLEDSAYARQLAASAHNTLSAYEWPVVRDAWLRVYRRVTGHEAGQLASHPVTPAPSNPA